MGGLPSAAPRTRRRLRPLGHNMCPKRSRCRRWSGERGERHSGARLGMKNETVGEFRVAPEIDRRLLWSTNHEKGRDLEGAACPVWSDAPSCGRDRRFPASQIKQHFVIIKITTVTVPPPRRASPLLCPAAVPAPGRMRAVVQAASPSTRLTT